MHFLVWHEIGLWHGFNETNLWTYFGVVLQWRKKNQLNAVRSQETHPKKCVHQSGRQKGELMKVEYSN